MNGATTGPSLLLLAAIVSASSGQQPAREPFASVAVGTARAELGRDGRFSLVEGERTLISGTRLVVAAPGWRGSSSQADCRMLPGYPRRAGEACEFSGEIAEEASGGRWRFVQHVQPVAGGARFVYTLSAVNDTRVGEVALFIHLPVATWEGQRIRLWPTREGTFPETKPERRHFLTGVARRIVLGSAEDGQLTVRFRQPRSCTAQDAREFGQASYHVYSRIHTGGEAPAGKEYRMEFTLVPRDHEEHRTATVQLRSTGSAGISELTASSDSVPRYGKLELTFNASGTWDNPFDPAQIAVEAQVYGPNGGEWHVPAFYYQEYEHVASGQTEILLPKGRPAWKARFAPIVPGPHRYVVRLTNQGATVRSAEGEFICTPAPADHGYVRVSNANPRYLQLDDGTPFFAVGMNVATLGPDRLASAERWYGKLAAVGGNFVRSWWCASGTDLESRISERADEGLGRIKLEDAWRIDYLVSLAERLGIRIMCCLETQQYLRRDKWWEQFTYNAANGGPVASPADYFANEACDEYFRRRLRYIVARWSYSTSVYGWQFWNEVSACNSFAAHEAARWHQRMARYLRAVDPVDHIIHTNFGNLDGYALVDGLPEMEVISTNSYSRRDMAQTGLWGTQWMTSRYPSRPYLLTEYGVGHKGGWVGEDPTGVIVHNGLWGPVVGGSAGTGLPWGWGNWIEAQDMYHFWAPVSAVVKGIPFHQRQWHAARIARWVFKDRTRRPYYAGVFFEGWPRNYAYTACPKPLPEVFHITSEGEVREQEGLNAVLGPGAACTFVAEFPGPAAFVVHVPEISDGGRPALHVAIDGRQVLKQDLPLGAGRPWEYWGSYSVPVPAGRHEVTLTNTGTGSVWTAYELQGFRRREGPDLDVAGMWCNDHILLWLRNPQFIWIYAREGRALVEQEEGLLTLEGVRDGTYTVSWRETTTNSVLAEGRVHAEAGRLTLGTPRITRSAVAKLVRNRERDPSPATPAGLPPVPPAGTPPRAW